jgi:hypothetical protein
MSIDLGAMTSLRGGRESRLPLMSPCSRARLGMRRTRIRPWPTRSVGVWHSVRSDTCVDSPVGLAPGHRLESSVHRHRSGDIAKDPRLLRTGDSLHVCAGSCTARL